VGTVTARSRRSGRQQPLDTVCLAGEFEAELRALERMRKLGLVERRKFGSGSELEWRLVERS
jgi:hypothetical protein